MKIRYKTATDDAGIVVDYYVQADPSEGRVKWLFYPNLPSGVDPRKGDEMGLGSLHDYDRQAYSDFVKAPRYTLSDDIYQQVLAVFSSYKIS